MKLWFSRRSRPAKIGLIVATLFVALSLCICGVAISTPTTNQPALSQQATSMPQASFAATSKPTKPPTAEPTQRRATATVAHGTPHLGGPISDFIAKYGTPNDHTDAQSYHWLRDSSSNVDGLVVTTTATIADGITVSAVNGAIWTTTTAQAACTNYNPSDAHQIRRVSVTDSSGSVVGFDVMYSSRSLAQAFAASDFTDANGNEVQRGSFDIQYLYKGDGSQNIDSCSIQLGQQQTV